MEAQVNLIKALQPEAKTIGVLYTSSEANAITQLNFVAQLLLQSGDNAVITIVQRRVAHILNNTDFISVLYLNGIIDIFRIFLGTSGKKCVYCKQLNKRNR